MRFFYTRLQMIFIANLYHQAPRIVGVARKRRKSMLIRFQSKGLVTSVPKARETHPVARRIHGLGISSPSLASLQNFYQYITILQLFLPQETSM